MPRRKKANDKRPRTLRYFQDRRSTKFAVVSKRQRSAPRSRNLIERLKGIWGGHASFDPGFLANLIGHSNNSNVRWFCDSTFFIAPTDDRIWNALLSKRDRLVLTTPVIEEIQQWLTSPQHNRSLHQEVCKRLSGDVNSPIRVFEPWEDHSRGCAMEYYINLIAHRKRLWAMAESLLQEELGRAATPQEVSNFCKDRWGMRSQLLAKKGAKPKVPAHLCNDEALVVMAVVDAICSGNEVVILTADEDTFEQFYKLVWLVDTHYRGMLLAQRYVEDPLFFGPTRIENEALSEGFEGDVILLRKQSDELRELLPAEWTLVPVTCMLIKNGMLTQHTFATESRMADVLAMKAKTGGRNSDLFGDRNCHVCLAGLMQRVGNVAAIGKDRSIAIAVEGRNYSLSLTDLNLVAYCRESFLPTFEIDAELLWLPPRFSD